MSWAPKCLEPVILFKHFLSCARKHSLFSCVRFVSYNQMSQLSYEDAVRTLNSLQSNAAVIEKARKERDKNAPLQVLVTEKYINRAGMTIEELDKKLNVIHVSGTKGKGSTCAFVESMLRHRGFKTGFYSSPHVVAVRERIRINGSPIAPDLFAKYFWDVYFNLYNSRENDEDMPAYFKFLTVLSMYIFLKENVNVAIMEVGIGGLYDCTNVFKKPTVVGISSLGIDHVSLLGDSIESIAAHKAGIMKHNIPAFTVPQPEEALTVLRKKARSVECPLYVVPPLDEYVWNPFPCVLGLAGKVQRLNASLALQLVHAWLKRTSNEAQPEDVPQAEVANAFRVSMQDALGLRLATWPGRSQILHCGPITYFLDGAHTKESMEACVTWFQEASQIQPTCRKILVFNTTGDRNPATLIDPLLSCNFDLVLFCPNRVSVEVSDASDQANLMLPCESIMQRCELNKQVFSSLQNSLHSSQTMTFSCTTDVVDWLRGSFGGHAHQQVQVLVTGSLHLVGGFLSLLDPDLTLQRDKAEVTKVLQEHYEDLVLPNHAAHNSP